MGDPRDRTKRAGKGELFTVKSSRENMGIGIEKDPEGRGSSFYHIIAL
jgi:hypothetical protein